MPARILTYRRPGTGGMVTDVPEWELKADQSPYMENQIMPRGVSAEAGGIGRFGPVGPAGDNQPLTGVGVYQFNGASVPDMLVTTAIGDFGVVNFGSPATVTTLSSIATLFQPFGPRWYPRAYVNGEVLCVSSSGSDSIVRYAGSRYQATAPNTGGVAVSIGSTTITGTSTTFLTDYRVGDYISLSGTDIAVNYTARIVAIQSNTLMSVDVPFTENEAAMVPPARSVFGLPGLGTRVNNQGVVTISGTAVTGFGTAWTTVATGNGILRRNDLIGADKPVTADPAIISSVSAGSLTVQAGATAITGEPYLALRPLAGYDVCVHRNRVLVGGTSWDPNLLQVLPAGAPLGQTFNEEDSADVDKVRARQAKYRYVPAPTTPGRIVALLSSDGPALILRSNNAYGMYGEYPDDTIDILPGDGAGAGCVDLRSACSGSPGQAWCGPEGVYLFRGGRVSDLTEGRRQQEWRRLMDEIDLSTASVSAGFYGNQLRIDICDGTARTVSVKDYLPPNGTSQTWVYDFAADAWCGLLTGTRARYLHTSQVPGYADELYGVSDDTTFQIATLGSSLRDEADATTTGRNPLVIDLAANADGGTLSALTRISQVKLTAEAPPTAEVSLQAGVGGTLRASGTQTITAEPAELVTQRYRPATDVDEPNHPEALGATGRVERLRITRLVDPAPDAFRIHEVEVIAKERHARG